MDFVHEWAPDELHADRLNSYAAGVGVSIGDVDGDGRPDVYLACQKKGGRLYRNLGGMRFEDVTDAAGLALDGFWGTGTTMVDIDNDGDLDLYLCAYAQPNRLYLNDGAGRFVEDAAAFGLDFERASVSAAFADYDLDGDLDCYLLTNYQNPTTLVSTNLEYDANGKPRVPYEYREFRTVLHPPPGAGKSRIVEAAQHDQLLRNDGGVFSDVTIASRIGWHYDHGLSATWWDYDRDGYPDLYVANDFYGADLLYHNNGDGTFEEVVGTAAPHIPWFSMGADAGDINNDGWPDLFAADMSATTHYRSKVTMGDMGEDAWFLDYADPQQYMRNVMLVNTQTPRFLETAHLSGIASTGWTWAAKFGDLDCDGRIDLFITNGMTRDFQNSDLKAASLEAQRSGDYETPHDFWEAQPVLAEPNMAFRNTGDFRFQDIGADWGLDLLGVSLGAAYGDLDGDGDLDIVVNNFDAPASLYQNQTSGDQHRAVIRLVGRASNTAGIGAEVSVTAGGVEHVVQLNLCRGYMSSDDPAVHVGLGAHKTIDRLAVRWPAGGTQVFEGLEAGRVYTVVEDNGSAEAAGELASANPPLLADSQRVRSALHQESDFDDFVVQPLLPNRLSRLGPGLAVGDVNGDGRDDFYLGGAAGQAGRVYIAGEAGFRVNGQASFHEDAGCEDMGALLFDADGDGDADLYVVSGGVEHGDNMDAYRDRLYLNDGAGVFSKAPASALPVSTDSGSCVVAADYDRDGDLDLFVGGRVMPGQYPLAPGSRLLRNDSAVGRAVFTETTGSAAPELADAGMVTGGVWADVDADGWIDLLVTCEWGPVRLYRNRAGYLAEDTQAAGLAGRHGWWNGVAGADLDHDGDIDFVVTNFGENTKYHPEPAHPYRIYYADFDGDGRRDVVEAKTVGEDLLPVRGFS